MFAEQSRKPDIEVRPHGEGWVVAGRGPTYQTKTAAIHAAIAEARSSGGGRVRIGDGERGSTLLVGPWKLGAALGIGRPEVTVLRPAPAPTDDITS